MNSAKELFQQKLNGKFTDLFLLENSDIQLAVTNYGARMVSLLLPGKHQKKVDVVVGFDSLDQYLQASEVYHGAIIGRYANRIAHGKFSLQGEDYQLPINRYPHHLHGGPKGFHSKVWNVENVNTNTITLSYYSPDREENYPGNLQVNLIFSITGNQEVILDYKATTDRTTIINLTSHPFFNLNGQGTGSILNHLLEISSDHFNPINQTLIPIGTQAVDNSPFDFRKSHRIGERINDDHQQLLYAGGYDHNFILQGTGFRSAARASGDVSGISMEVLTDQPGMQLYSGNFMKGENTIKNGFRDAFRTAFCLETQHFPDAPNHPDFPSVVLQPGEIFSTRTMYRFFPG